MAKNPTEKRILKKQALIARTALVLGVTPTEAESYLRTPRHQSVRLNPLKGDVHETEQQLAAAGWHGTPISWMPHGMASADPIEAARDSSAVQEGRAFIQNAASWLPVAVLDPQPGEAILDVCAAPGGKTSHIAAMAHNQAHITANDNSRIRLNKLIANLQRLGIDGVETTLYDATQIAKKMAGQQFDKILLDAPCSGEGMMHLDSDNCKNGSSLKPGNY
jgi:16S rRNA C967 or C1407 C5-methylase (RsmB/RsmF family)